jgi:hypothetical protein
VRLVFAFAILQDKITGVLKIAIMKKGPEIKAFFLSI